MLRALSVLIMTMMIDQCFLFYCSHYLSDNCVLTILLCTHVLHMMCTQPFRASSNLQPFHLPHTYPHCHVDDGDDVDDDFDGDVLTIMTIDHLSLTFHALL